MKRIREDAKTIQLSLAIGFAEIVRYDEKQINPKSARSRALNKLIDDTWRVVDMYRINAFSPAKLKFASEILDAVELLVHNRTGAYYEWRSGWQ